MGICKVSLFSGVLIIGRNFCVSEKVWFLIEYYSFLVKKKHALLQQTSQTYSKCILSTLSFCSNCTAVICLILGRASFPEGFLELGI